MECCSPFFKGMILAAGRGKRMEELTSEVPKPLLTIAGQPLILFNIKLFLHWGINYIVVNTWYQQEKLCEYLAKLNLPVRIKISYESTLMGTGGGVKKAFNYLKGTPFFLINSDIITDFPLKVLINEPLPLATMVVVPHREGNTPVWVKDGRVTSIGERGEGKNFTFAGIHLLTGRIFKYLPEGESSIIKDFYIKALGEGENIRAVIWDGLWLDAGTKERFMDTKAAIESGEINLPSYLLDMGSI